MYADGTQNFSLSSEQFNAVNAVLELFFQRSRCRAVVLANASGMLITQFGEMEAAHLSLLSTLAAADYAASTEMARLIGEKLGFRVHFYEGETSNVYITSVRDDFFLVVVFSNQISFGMVRVLTAKAISELSRVLTPGSGGTPRLRELENLQGDFQSDEFQDELSLRLDAALRETE